jgi:hypothetical protein
LIVHAGRELPLQALELLDHRVVDVERVRGRQLDDPHADPFDALESQLRRIRFRAELCAADVAHPDERPALTRLENDVVELVRLPEAADSAHAELIHLPGGRRRLSQAAGGDLNVLLPQRVHDVICRDLARRHAVGIEPQPHRVLPLAEDDDVRDAGNALQRVAYVDVEVVAQEQRVVLAVLGVDTNRRDESGRLLLDGDAGRAHFRRHAAERLVDAVLHVDGSHVLIARDVERHADLADAAVRAGGGHVEHPLHTVDRLLERRRHRRLDFLRVGAGVERSDRDLRRRQRRILRDRHRRDGEQARENQHERADRCENRPADEDVDEHRYAAPACYSARTGAPSASFWTPETMIRSPAFSPPVTT